MKDFKHLLNVRGVLIDFALKEQFDLIQAFRVTKSMWMNRKISYLGSVLYNSFKHFWKKLQQFDSTFILVFTTSTTDIWSLELEISKKLFTTKNRSIGISEVADKPSQIWCRNAFRLRRIDENVSFSILFLFVLLKFTSIRLFNYYHKKLNGIFSYRFITSTSKSNSFF